jgi:hypothetical protein
MALPQNLWVPERRLLGGQPPNPRDFLRHGSGVRLAGKEGGPAIRVGGGAEERRRRTVGLAIPRRVASPQSPTPFRQAS